MNESCEKRSQAKKDVVTGLVLCAVTAFLGWSLFTNDGIVGADFGADPGPGLVPALLLRLLGLCALAMIAVGLRNLRQVRKAEPHGASATSWKALLLPGLLAATMIVYLWALQVIGFLLITAVFTLGWMFVIGKHDDGKPTKRAVIRYVAQAVALTVVVYVVFTKLIHVPLP